MHFQRYISHSGGCVRTSRGAAAAGRCKNSSIAEHRERVLASTVIQHTVSWQMTGAGNRSWIARAVAKLDEDRATEAATPLLARDLRELPNCRMHLKEKTA